MKKLSFCMLPLALAVSSAVIADEKQDELKSIEHIVVYGEKNARSLKDTTSSVAVITAEELANGQADSYTDALAGMANVVLTNSLPSIRGVEGEGVANGFSSFSSGAKPRVSILKDGVAEPFVAMLSGDQGMWDVQQLEVLRGPQSSNSGRNSIGGVVYITTKAPSLDDTEFAARAGYTNTNKATEGALMLSSPLITDELAYRLTVQRLAGDSHLNYQLAEGDAFPFDPKAFGLTSSTAKLLWQPANIAGLKMLLQYSVAKETGERFWNLQGPDLSKRISASAWNSETSFARDKELDNKRLSLKTNYQLNESLDVEVLLAKMDYDYQFTQHPLIWHVKMLDDNQTMDTKLNYQGSGSFSGYIGAYRFARDQLFSNRDTYSGYDDSSANAIYGEGSWQFTKQSRLIAGGRIEDEKQYRLFAYDAGTEFVTDVSERIYLPKIAYLYDLDQATTVGASFRKGYSSGGGDFSMFNGSGYTFAPEFVNTYELSLRQVLNESKVNLSFNLFYNNYKQYQFFGTGPSGMLDDYLIVNLPKVSSYGFETELSYAISPDLTLRGGLGLVRNDIKDPGVTNQEMKSQELPLASDLTANIGLEYWLTEQLQLQLSTYHVGDYQSRMLSKALAEDPTLNVTQAKLFQAGGYTETKLSASYQLTQWRFDLYLSNAFDRISHTYIDRYEDNQEIGVGNLTEPRTLGFSLSYEM